MNFIANQPKLFREIIAELNYSGAIQPERSTLRPSAGRKRMRPQDKSGPATPGRKEKRPRHAYTFLPKDTFFARDPGKTVHLFFQGFEAASSTSVVPALHGRFSAFAENSSCALATMAEEASTASFLASATDSEDSRFISARRFSYSAKSLFTTFLPPVSRPCFNSLHFPGPVIGNFQDRFKEKVVQNYHQAEESSPPGSNNVKSGAYH